MKKNIEKKPVIKDFEYYFHLTKGQKQIKFTGTLNCSELTKVLGE